MSIVATANSGSSTQHLCVPDKGVIYFYKPHRIEVIRIVGHGAIELPQEFPSLRRIRTINTALVNVEHIITRPDVEVDITIKADGRYIHPKNAPGKYCIRAPYCDLTNDEGCEFSVLSKYVYCNRPVNVDRCAYDQIMIHYSSGAILFWDFIRTKRDTKGWHRLAKHEYSSLDEFEAEYGDLFVDAYTRKIAKSARSAI